MFCIIIFSRFYGMYLKKSWKLLQMNSESHLSAGQTSFFTLFGPYSIYLQGIYIPPLMTYFPSGTGLGSPVTSLSIISVCWFFINLNNFLASVSGILPTVSSISSFPYFTTIALSLCLLSGLIVQNRRSPTFTPDL